MPPTLSPFTALRAFSRCTRLPVSSRLTPSKPQLALPFALQRLSSSRFSTTPLIRSKPLTDRQSSPPPSSHEPAPPRPPQPEYQITFTCTPCSTRSAHRISKQGYHHGSVLITCPDCKNKHVISDHLNIFGDKEMTIEDLMRERGQLVKKGTLSEDGDLEFWEDGSVSSSAEGKGDEKGVLSRGTGIDGEEQK